MNNPELDQQMIHAQRYMAAFTYHSVLLSTYGEYGVNWAEELGEMIDSLHNATNVLQGVFDQLQANHE
jgi:hypothetical protein